LRTRLLATGIGGPAAAGEQTRLPSRTTVAAEIGRYLLVGALATALSAGLFYLLRTSWAPLPSSLLAVAASTVVSTEANRRFTFAAAGVRTWRMHVQGAGTVVFYVSYGAAVLTVLPALVTDPTPLQETYALAAASVLGGASRFLLLRNWVFAPSAPGPTLPSRPRAGTVRAMTRSTVRRFVLTLLAGTAVLFSTAGACGGGDGDDDDGGGAPGMTQQDDD